MVALVVTNRLDLLAGCVPDPEETPEDAARLEWAMTAAVRVLRAHIGPLDVGVIEEVYAAPERDVVGLAAPRGGGEATHG